MKRFLVVSILLAAAISCNKAPVVKVTAHFTTNKDVYQIGEELLIENTSSVENNILAFCKWECNEVAYYGLSLEGLSFAEPGKYTITLTAYAEQGAGEDTYSREILIIDENDVPWAFFECPGVVKVGEEVLFDDKSIDIVGGIKTWKWDIGGTVSEYQSPLIVFDVPANDVNVSLTVTDAFGLSGTFSRTIDVTN